MTAVPVDAASVSDWLSRMQGARAWAPTLGVGSFLTVEFGDPLGVTAPGQRAHGAFHLWVYCSAWRIDEPDGMVCGSEDPREKLQADVRRLDGAVLRSAFLDGASCGLVLDFDSGLRLSTFAIFSRGFEHWYLYLPDGNVLTAGPGRAYSVERAASTT